MMVVCNGNVTIEYDRRRPGIPSAPLNRIYDNHGTEI